MILFNCLCVYDMRQLINQTNCMLKHYRPNVWIYRVGYLVKVEGDTGKGVNFKEIKGPKFICTHRLSKQEKGKNIDSDYLIIYDVGAYIIIKKNKSPVN